MSLMQFWSAVSLETDASAIGSDLRDQLGPASDRYDLVVAFVRPPDGLPPEEIIHSLRESLPAAHFLACTAESVVAGGREIEDQPATALLAARLPGVTIDPLPRLETESDIMPTVLSSLSDQEKPVPDLPDDVEAFIALVDPFSVQTDRLVKRFNELAPGVPVIGGMASWATVAGQNRLAHNDVISNGGVAGVMLRGNVDVRVVVSQGCSPVGPPLTVTASEGRLIRQLDDRPPLEVLQEVFERADEETRLLMRSGVLVGHGISREAQALGRGGYVIRGLLGVDSESGAMTVGDQMRDGDIVQFHVRDATTAREDLELLLTPQAFEEEASGALLFTCNGRGSRMYGYPDGDISIVHKALGDDVPVAGFFCGGELGPIGGTNFVHGFTASMAIFRPKH